MKMKILLHCFLFFGLVQCASKSRQDLPQDYSRTFKAPYETVWRATQQALLNYPMNINNMDTGNLQTLFITGKHRYIAPHEKKKILPSGYQYRLNINIIKAEDRSKIIISKETRLQKDFFSEPQELTSDGFEEKALIYRIRREILIENLLKKNMPKEAPKTTDSTEPTPSL